jgi:hypothetical protein
MSNQLLRRWGNKSAQNPKGHTGNPIVDLFNGREINPKHFGLDFKLQTFRCAVWPQNPVLILMVNVVLVPLLVLVYF